MSTSVFNFKDQETIERKISVGLERISQVLKTLIWSESATTGLSPIQIQFLVYLNYRGEAKVNDLADYFNLTPATVSEAVSTLEAKKLVLRERGVEDRRTVWLKLTARGKRLASKISSWANVLEDVVKVLSKDEKKVMLKALVNVIYEFQKRGLIKVSEICITCKYFRPNVHKSALKPHHCDFVGKPFGDVDLRIDCPDYEMAEELV